MKLALISFVSSIILQRLVLQISLVFSKRSVLFCKRKAISFFSDVFLVAFEHSYFFPAKNLSKVIIGWPFSVDSIVMGFFWLFCFVFVFLFLFFCFL